MCLAGNRTWPPVKSQEESGVTMSDLLQPGKTVTHGVNSAENGPEMVITARPRNLGGIEIRRVLPFFSRRMVGPWIFFDHIGPVQLQPGTGIEIPPHPHINLATVTYVFEGEIMHRDSLGMVQSIQPGAINLMVAGKGIAHSERSLPELRARGFNLHSLQLWLALPEGQEEIDPAFYHYPAADLPGQHSDGVALRVLMGEGFGLSSQVTTFSPTIFAEATLSPGARLALPHEIAEKGVYIVSGNVRLNNVPVPVYSMAVCQPGTETVIEADSAAQVVIIGGANIGKRHIWWNFVSSRLERIEQAKADWKEGRFAQIPGETEFVPLPER
jgi:redox-sensitive bicupin YhaK (pirin superfamily)